VTPSSTALAVVVAIVGGTMLFALWSVRRLTLDPAQFIVGGRSFGTILLWVLMAGEIYTSFTFLGMAGWAYGLGAPAYYIPAYGTIGYIVSYFLLPAIWRVGKERGLLTAPDFLADRYGSRALGIFAGVVYFILVVPYVTLQLSGLQTLLSVAGYGSFNATAAVVVAFIAIAFFVFTAGLRGAAWASIVKDALVLGAITFAGIAIPVHFFGSPAGMIDQVLRAHPGWLTLQPGTSAHGTIWYVSTVLLTGIGFFMGPQSINAVYSARSENVLRRNAVLLPLYQVVMLMAFFAGLSALLIAPGLKGPAVDQSFLLVVQRYYPPWLMGFVAGAGALAALIPASALLLGASGVFTENVLVPFGIVRGDGAKTMAMRVLVIVVALLALALWLRARTTLVELLLLYFSGVTQFLPAFVATFAWPRVTVWGVTSGIVVGLTAAVVLTNLKLSVWGLNPGFLALAANVLVVVAVSLATRAFDTLGVTRT
jgi:solute:Na+ symporter, SSS family